jgi:hypothetical protein
MLVFQVTGRVLDLVIWAWICFYSGRSADGWRVGVYLDTVVFAACLRLLCTLVLLINLLKESIEFLKFLLDI